MNTSNQGINSLTLQNRNPILGWQTQDSTINVFTLGESHSFGRPDISSKVTQVCNQARIYSQAAQNYMQQFVKTIHRLVISPY